MAIWLLKSEPGEYSFAKLTEEGKATWTGIRNFQARNNLRAMKAGELALFFHTGSEKAVVGVAKIAGEARPDPTAPKGEDWSAVEVAPVKALAEPVPLATLKAAPALKGMALVKQGRLSVSPVTKDEFAAVLKLGKTKR